LQQSITARCSQKQTAKKGAPQWELPFSIL
jgi:hypothetical protein